MRVVDTDILIDVLRGFAPSLQWFATLPEPPAVVSLSVMELVQGCRSQQELQQVLHLVAPLTVWCPTEDEMRVAMELFLGYYLRHRMGIIDALIGTCVAQRGGTLCTFNVRHYRVVPGLITEVPYERSTPNE